MSSSRKKKKREKTPPMSFGWGELSLIALFLSRFLVPTEAAGQGLTLWLSAATFGLATVMIAVRWRNRESVSVSFSLLDLAVAAMVCGHAISGIVVLMGAGNRRTALNMVWEWIAIGSFWIMLRLFLQRKASRQLLVQAFSVMVLGFGLLGLWQHYVWYPQQAKSFERLLELNEQGMTRNSLSSHEQSEYKELLNQFGTEVLTLDEPGRMSFLSRVRDSVEPIGLFVLANTFAIPLLVAFLWLLFGGFQHWGNASIKYRIGMGVAVVIPLFCLILTKSRTAWIGTLAGLAVAVFLNKERVRTSLNFSRKFYIVGFCLFAALILGTVLSGGLDPQVISEAPKSLQYRLEYWSATVDLLGDRPIFGAGPGNFRQHYVKYKLPGASEEILDPHNLFIGIWSGGGLLAFLGLCLLIFSGIAAAFNTEASMHDAQDDEGRISLPIHVPLLLAYSFTLFGIFLLEGRVDQRLLLLAVLTLGLSGMLNVSGIRVELIPAAILASLIALLVHLLGASGIEMPAVVLLLLVLSHLLSAECSSVRPPFKLRERTLFAATFVNLGALVGSLMTGLIPVQLAQTDISIGNSLILVQGNAQGAKKYFLSAIEADSLSPEPHQQLALLHFRNWQSSGMNSQEEFNNAVKSLQEAIDLDPFAAGRYRSLGNFWDKKAEHSGELSDAKAAVAAYREAIKLYPNLAALQAELAIAVERANEPATQIATRALELDELNQKNGHSDKYLSEDIRQRLHEILATDH